MLSNKTKIKLSPRLRWGVGRDINKFNFFKLGGGIFLALSAVLVIRATWLIFSPGEPSPKVNPQVLGETDTKKTEAFTEYKVKQGDTLFTIAKDSNLEWTIIATLNNLKAPFALKPGQSLKIPKP